MNLVIDVGNTRTKAGLFSGDDLIRYEVFSKTTAGSILSVFEPRGISTCIVSSVTQDHDPLVKELGEQFQVYVLDVSSPLPFINKYETPHTLGNDRKANAAGASKLFPGKNVLVIDAGTCLKTDFINAGNEYTGGSISPGLEMRFKALNSFTSRLPLIGFEEWDYFMGTTTKRSIIAGVAEGMLFEIEGFIEKYRSHYAGLQIILTGGDAPVFDKKLKNSIFAAPHLALTGLNEILKHNV